MVGVRYTRRPVPQDGSRVTEEPSILERVAAGDPAAPNECIARFSGLVWSLARRLCSSPSDAADAVQEIFIDLWKSAPRFDSSIASETTFVAMIARRRLIDRGRRKMRRPEVPQIAETVADSRERVDDTERGEQQRLAIGQCLGVRHGQREGLGQLAHRRHAAILALFLGEDVLLGGW